MGVEKVQISTLSQGNSTSLYSSKKDLESGDNKNFMDVKVFSETIDSQNLTKINLTFNKGTFLIDEQLFFDLKNLYSSYMQIVAMGQFDTT